MQLSAAIRNYTAFQEARGDTLTHRKECARILTLLQDRLGDLDIVVITADDLREFLTAVRSRPGAKGRRHVSDLTVFAYHRTLAAFFNQLVRQELIARNPMQYVPKPKTGQYLIKPLSEDQVQKLLAQPDTSSFAGLRDLVLMLFLLDTGCRISEALSLTLDSLDLESRTARVVGKGARQRDVPFGRTTRAWIERYLERRQGSAAFPNVFVNQYGEPLTRFAVNRRLADYGRRAGLRGVRVSPHTFRHTFGINWLLGTGEYKGDTISLQKLLGHTTPAMTQRYVHLTGQDLSKLHDRLSPADRLIEPPEVTKRKRL
jgi:integrase/recombinase XerD